MTENFSVKPFPSSSRGEVNTTALLQLIHSDVMGPMETKSQGGARFVVTFLDDCPALWLPITLRTSPM